MEAPSFSCEDWILVTDKSVAGDLTQAQLSSLNKFAGCSTIRVLDCAADDSSEPCQKIPTFPTLCHANTSSCFPGVAETQDHFDAMRAKLAGQSGH